MLNREQPYIEDIMDDAETMDSFTFLPPTLPLEP